ncbi:MULTISPECIES: Rha family transcriptional regulator [Pseudomonas]|jgi:phage regulator Rha-like protein|uniref:Phage antirepressor protein n=1 Tax=Pseudomonas simiae TaxID=321846 RepID=A0A1N7U4Q1_9PSED|nr:MULTISPECIES: Rha family transcriptional regulator [Pseudomonas]AIB35896.1 phage antirepressor protein [Pseudomonas simiae]
MHQHTESINSPNNLAPRFSQSQNVARTTMSSREIADLTGKRHDHVMRDIRNMLSELKITDPKFGGTYMDGSGRSMPCFHLDRELTETLVTGYSIPLRHKVIRRLHELEDAQAVKSVAMPSYAEALRLYADQIEQTAVLRVENRQQATKINSLENLFKEGMTHTQFCKGLNGVNVMQVGNYLEERSWLYNESKSGTRHRVGSYARDKYMTEHQVEVTPHGKDPFISYTPILLKKGAARLYDLYLAGELPMKKTWDGLFTHDKAQRAA